MYKVTCNNVRMQRDAVKWYNNVMYNNVVYKNF